MVFSEIFRLSYMKKNLNSRFLNNLKIFSRVFDSEDQIMLGIKDAKLRSAEHTSSFWLKNL